MSIYVILEGGIVQAVCATTPELIGKQVVIIDYDAEGADDVTNVRQSDGKLEPAVIGYDEVRPLVVEVIKPEKKPTSWRPEVIADSSGKWCANGQRFATEGEAILAARDLMSRWVLVTDTRATESDDPVNYRWTNGAAVPYFPPQVSEPVPLRD